MPRNSNARMVAKKVIEQIEEGKRPNIKEAALAVGYSSSTANKQAKRITEKKEYKEELFDFMKALDEVQNDAINIMKAKKDKATYRDGVEATDKITKLKQLISGKPTENTKMVVEWDE